MAAAYHEAATVGTEFGSIEVDSYTVAALVGRTEITVNENGLKSAVSLSDAVAWANIVADRVKAAAG
jgi:hypothetical protein